MASAISPDFPVHLKISVNGEENRKFKVAIKDLGSSTLPSKLRSLLRIPESQEATFERYSDSSASYVVLDSANPSIYKQLYRAAKAKGKLRLRVTTKEGPSTKTEEPVTQIEYGTTAQLPSRRYVRPYVSEAAGQEAAPSSRLSTLEDLKTLSDAPTAIPVTVTPSAKPQVESTRSPKPEATQSHFWPVAANSAWSAETKAAFDKNSQRSTQEALRKIKEAIAAQTHVNRSTAFAPTPAAVKPEENEAPVPRFFSARERCRAEFNAWEANAPSRTHVDASKPCTSFYIFCNKCNEGIPDAHWHCSICDKGDFDLCLKCVEGGSICQNDQHWLIRRTVENGQVVNSKVETIGPKKTAKKEIEEDIPGAFEKTEIDSDLSGASRTCNCCISVFDESEFVTCQVCDDYDLCIPCHVAQTHGHHPAHAFGPATPATQLETASKALLPAGRNKHHWATCDGCDKEIYGVRNKCLDCPDWDFCAECIKTAKTIHPQHRFAPIYEPLTDRPFGICDNRVHEGIYCDGPLCEGNTGFIRGDRFKCAVCHDTDFCASCEALPRLEHNRTHPLLKFKTPVRNVSVSTYGDRHDGSEVMTMGDRVPQTSSKATETTPANPSVNAATQVQTVAEVQPVKKVVPTENLKLNGRVPVSKPADLAMELNAHFVHDTVTDGTIMAPDAQFTQTWTMHNPGPHTWPAGCCIYFIGGDSMLDIDPHHPAHVSHIRKATKSNALPHDVLQGEEAQFTVKMRAPEREGTAISYWRMKNADGVPFGHKLWCDIKIVKAKEEAVVPAKATEENAESEKEKSKSEAEQSESQMIFPKLDKESPIASATEVEVEVAPAAPVPAPRLDDKQSLDDVESLGLDDDGETSDEGFLTDEEYELIASGDEYEEAKNGRK